MARVIINKIPYEIPDNSILAEICEKAGLLFNCNTGICGSCKIQILSGEKNLSDLTDEELNLGLNLKSRLACQCTILSGQATITF